MVLTKKTKKPQNCANYPETERIHKQTRGICELISELSSIAFTITMLTFFSVCTNGT